MVELLAEVKGEQILSTYLPQLEKICILDGWSGQINHEK